MFATGLKSTPGGFKRGVWLSIAVVVLLNAVVVYSFWLTEQQKSQAWRMQQESLTSSALYLTSELLSYSLEMEALARARSEFLPAEQLQQLELRFDSLWQRLAPLYDSLSHYDEASLFANPQALEAQFTDIHYLLRGRNNILTIGNNHTLVVQDLANNYVLIPGVNSAIQLMRDALQANNLLLLGELSRTFSEQLRQTELNALVTARMRNLALGTRGIFPIAEERIIQDTLINREIQSFRQALQNTIVTLRQTPDLLSAQQNDINPMPGWPLMTLALLILLLLSLTWLMAWHWSRYLSSARQAERLESLGRISGEVAHDIHNMISVTISSLNVLRESQSDQSRRHDRTLDRALFAADKSIGMIDRLLTFAKRKELSPEPIVVNEVIEGLYEVVCLTCGESVEVVLELCQEDTRLTLDPGQLESAILNLCINARNAMDGKGRIVLRTRIRVRRQLVISVEDNGRGIPKAVLPRVFEPFFSADETHQGQGLGLSTVYGFVRQSGGDVTIDSTEGKGTVVSLLFRKREAVL